MKNLPPNRRVVVLGASNVAMGLRTLFAEAQRAWGQPLEAFVAIGHGRGYGNESRVLGRVLPPIIECGLWEELARRTAMPTAALVTDIGNDLLFGTGAEEILQWVSQCLERLAATSQQITLTQLPVANLEKLHPWCYRFMRSALFPRSRLPLEQALQSAHQINQGLREVAQMVGAQVVSPCERWYGWDPIHIRMSYREEAWQHFLSSWQTPGFDTSSPSRTQYAWWHFARLRPLRRTLLGIEQHRTQPATRLHDGSTIALY